MVKSHIADMINTQIKNEFYSAYLYLDMANYYADMGLDGFENWFLIQAQEERDHAMLFRKYLQNNGYSVKLQTVEAPEFCYQEPIEPLEKALSQEKIVTQAIHGIYDMAHKEGDWRTLEFLNWFVKEQGEEEKSADDLVTKFKLFGGNGSGLLAFDKVLGERTYSPPDLDLD